MTKTEKFLLENNIYFYKENNKIIITRNGAQITRSLFNSTKSYQSLESVTMNMTKLEDDLFCDCIIMRSVDLEKTKSIGTGCFNNCTIEGFLDLQKIKSIDNSCFNNCIIEGYINLSQVEYLPNGFCPKINKKIWADNLKPKILKELIHLPGIKRQLGFNLLK